MVFVSLSSKQQAKLKHVKVERFFRAYEEDEQPHASSIWILSKLLQ